MSKMRVDVTEHMKFREAYYDRGTVLTNESEKRKKLVENILDVFGLRDAYPDIRTTTKQMVVATHPSTLLPSWVERDVETVDAGADRFVNDLENAVQAKRGTDAYEYIREALKQGVAK